MLQSRLFTKTRKQDPAQEESINAKLLTRAGFVEKSSAGVYVFLPLALRVLHKIIQIVREEMNAIGAEELLMPSLVSKEYWEATGRWDVDVMYKLSDIRGSEFGLGWTHEEVITAIAKNFILSYQDLPKAVYQIQMKFRSEARAKSGLLRGREFLMKDLYSFHETEEDLQRYYAAAKKAYQKVFKRMGLEVIYTEAAGGTFTAGFTNEFQVLNEAGEDTIFYCADCSFAQNQEIAKISERDKCPRCEGQIAKANAIEVGNIFPLGTRYSKAISLAFRNKKGEENLVVMGSYGIGISRLLGTIAEVFYDAHGLLWPESVAPFQAHLIEISGFKRQLVKKASETLYKNLLDEGVDVLYDDRDAKTPGEKFTDADLIGIPLRIVASARTLAKHAVEIKKRNEKNAKIVPIRHLRKFLEKNTK